MTDTVPFLDLARLHAELRAELDDAWHRAVDSSGFIGGAAVERFETDWAAYCGTRHCVGVSDGTAAIELALAALRIGVGDEVIVPANTFIATVEAVTKVGAVPVFVDVDPATLLLDPNAAAAAIGPRTRAIIAVHLYGQPCDMDVLQALADRHGLELIEDAAQAHGATWRGRRAGSLGRVGCFSFYPGKNLGAFGDAGAVTTDDPAIAQEIRSRANHGRPLGIAERCDVLDGNHRLDALQAAILAVKLRHLDRWNAARAAVMQRYVAELGPAALLFPTIRAEATSSCHLAIALVPDRDEVRRRLAAAGIATGIHYAIPCHRQPACAELVARARQAPQVPVVDATADRLLSLPLFPQLTSEEVQRVIDAVTAILATTDPAIRDQAA
jgi:dTDP-4-amino-4,6-dideoxygalactose transaminase